MLKFIKEWFANLMQKLGESNEQNLGNQRLDCCDLNQASAKKKK